MIQTILGTLILFLPGYLLDLILFKKQEPLERCCMSIGLSFAIIVTLGFLLTLVSNILDVKAINSLTVFLSMILLSLVFTMIILLKKIFSRT